MSFHFHVIQKALSFRRHMKSINKGCTILFAILILPTIWGIIGLLNGDGFIDTIVENIQSAIVIIVIILAAIGLLTISKDWR